jgi:hypothetical protein
MRPVAFRLTFAALLAVAVPVRPAQLAQPSAPAIEAARQALVGEWRLDAARSDDQATLVLAHAVASGRAARGPSGGDPWIDAPWAGDPWTGPHGRGGLRVAVGGGVDPDVIFAPSQLTVTNLVPEVTILVPDGAVRRLQADARPHRADKGVETTARWDGGRLLVETRTRRSRILETWSASPEPRRLELLLEVARPAGGTIAIRRVFVIALSRATVEEPQLGSPGAAESGSLPLRASRANPSAAAEP